jgi:hypothetical protein
MTQMKMASLYALALALAGCASIIEGTSQEITINTNPTGAACTLMREGQPIGSVNPTPGTVLIKKTKYDLNIVCDRPGFDQATFLNHSGAAGATFGNIILGGGIGWAIDSAAGADNKYETPVNLTMVPKSAVVPLTMPAPVPTPMSRSRRRTRADGRIELRRRASRRRSIQNTAMPPMRVISKAPPAP